MVDPNGSPVGGAPVVLSRETSVGELFGGFFLASLTLFTACLADPAPAICRSGLRRAATTGDDGGAAFSLTGKDTQTAFGTASTFSLSSRVPPLAGQQSGPVATYRFAVQTEDLVLPDLRLWEPAFRLTAATASWTAMPASGFGTGTGYRLLFEDTAGASVWSFDADSADLAFDPRVLEDSRGGSTVVAHRKLSATGTGVDAVYASARVAYAGTAGAPPSRGAACSLLTGSGAPVPVSPCPLTDGDFTSAVMPASPPSTATAGAPAGPTAAIVDLGAPHPVSLVVVRGCACALDTSTDGTAWSPLGTLASTDTSLEPPRPTTARYVRVRSDAGVGSLREVSVWEGAGAANGGTATGASTGGAAGGSAAVGGSTAHRSRAVAIAVAIALAVLVTGIGAVLVATRRVAR